MLTKKDLQQISQIITEAFDDPNNSLRKELKNDLLTFKDEILGEIKDLRDDVAVVTGYKDQIEDHEVRIDKLERLA